ncbi:MAG: DUF192 domain-containing protein [Candidatus Micrarchaeota archaeon]|nr:DUF192 domain-containing protein [Candidatus Micrarchaeota archaeon]
MRFKVKQFTVTAMLSIFVIGVLFSLLLLTTQNYGPHIYETITINSKTFNITALALNESQWQKGLMNATVTNSTLILFEFNQTADWPFWMYNTYTNLDMLWINYSYSSGSGNVIYIVKNATSCFVASKCQIYDPHNAANFVLEAKAGFANRNNIGVGNSVVLR